MNFVRAWIGKIVKLTFPSCCETLSNSSCGRCLEMSWFILYSDYTFSSKIHPLPAPSSFSFLSAVSMDILFSKMFEVPLIEYWQNNVPSANSTNCIFIWESQLCPSHYCIWLFNQAFLDFRQGRSYEFMQFIRAILSSFSQNLCISFFRNFAVIEIYKQKKL